MCTHVTQCAGFSVLGEPSSAPPLDALCGQQVNRLSPWGTCGPHCRSAWACGHPEAGFSSLTGHQKQHS